MERGRWKVGFVVLALALAVAGCAKSNKDLLPGAVYAAKTVTVYRHAELKDMMGSESYGDEPGSYTKGQCWFFSVKDSKEKVLAYYEQQFPNAERITNEDGSVTLRIIPEGADKFEDVHVTVRDGELQIAESVKPNKIKS
ncbi:MAG TPA: hypothetical protein VGK89_10580 [Candidatus Eisenbacteria bacterium]|jgi:hypothetical protein